MLSQEEINALLGGSKQEEGDPHLEGNTQMYLNEEEIDALGEIGNISMGTAATTLFTLLNHKVLITTPKVEVLTWHEFVNSLSDDLTAVSVDYTQGFKGSNLMILKDQDVKVITDLMMGETGIYKEGPVTELHLSAIAESMNQMIGSSSTSMAQIFNKKIDISPPKATKMEGEFDQFFETTGVIVKISFRFQIEENIIDSELMQILPIEFAKDLITGLFEQENKQKVVTDPEPVAQPVEKIKIISENPNREVHEQVHSNVRQNVGVQLPQFQSFDQETKVYPKENMNLLMDVSLEVSVELGRTHKKIKEILEYGPGSIIELNRLVGEPVDVLVNGKFIATGEVVVIDENFGIRITDIINPENRI